MDKLVGSMVEEMLEAINAAMCKHLDTYGWESADGDEAIAAYAQACAAIAQKRVNELEAHIREQITHVETRIQDGIEMGAAVWRIALEDVARENRAALPTPEVPGESEEDSPRSSIG